MGLAGVHTISEALGTRRTLSITNLTIPKWLMMMLLL